MREIYQCALTLLLLLMITGCAPPTSVTKSKINITVVQPTNTEWAYVISTTGGSNFTKVVFTLTVSGCNVKSMPIGWKSGAVNGGIQVESATGAVTANITLECDAQDGPNYIDVHILGGAAATLGPVSGPT
jgi:hypothetical protein